MTVLGETPTLLEVVRTVERAERVEEAGLVISSVSAKEGLVEIVELPSHPFFIGAQFHPEFRGSDLRGPAPGLRALAEC